MGGFLRFLAWFVLLVAVLVLVILPLLLSPLLAGMVRDMGVRADTIEVSVALFDPGLLLGRSSRITLNASHAQIAPATIGQLRLSLGDVSYFDRSFASVSGELSDVGLTLGGDTVDATTLSVDGPAGAANATARFSTSQAERLVKVAAARNGLNLDQVRMTDSGIKVTLHGVESDARLMARGGALLLDPGMGGPVVLLQPAPSDPWTLTDVWFSDGDLNVSATIDVTSVVRGLASAT